MVYAYVTLQCATPPKKLFHVSKMKRSAHIHPKAIWFNRSLYYQCLGNYPVEVGEDRRRRQDGSAHKAFIAEANPMFSVNYWLVIRGAAFCRVRPKY